MLSHQCRNFYGRDKRALWPVYNLCRNFNSKTRLDIESDMQHVSHFQNWYAYIYHSFTKVNIPYIAHTFVWHIIPFWTWLLRHPKYLSLMWAMFFYHINGLVQDCSISIAKALEILQSCTKPSIFGISTQHKPITNHLSLLHLGHPLIVIYLEY